MAYVRHLRRAAQYERVMSRLKDEAITGAIALFANKS